MEIVPLRLYLRTARALNSLFLSLLFWLPSLKFCIHALFGLYCVISCYLHRPTDCSAGKLRETFTAAAGGFSFALIGGLVGQRHDQIEIAQAWGP